MSGGEIISATRQHRFEGGCPDDPLSCQTARASISARAAAARCGLACRVEGTQKVGCAVMTLDVAPCLCRQRAPALVIAEQEHGGVRDRIGIDGSGELCGAFD